jgi:hypothetical protein
LETKGRITSASLNEQRTAQLRKQGHFPCKGMVVYGNEI